MPDQERRSVDRLIVFDFDNTIVHSVIDFAGIRRDLIALFRQAGVPEAVDDRLAILSIGQMIDTGIAFAPSTHDPAWQIVLEYETDGMRHATVEPDASASLHALRDAGFQLAVLTNNARPATLTALDLFELRSAFDLILTRDEVPMKPDPTGITHAMTHFGIETHGTVMVGDSWLDGTAAQKAGVRFIGFQPRAGVLDERGVPYWAIVERLTALRPLVTGPWPAMSPRPA
jgi:phosphoglycolate phosphatase